MKRRFIFGVVAVALLLNVAVGAKIYWAASKAATAEDDPSANLALFSDALQKIRSEYVDGKDLNYQQMVSSALKGVVGRLDPHSEFLDAEAFQQLEDDTEGQFGGLGLVVALSGGYITVVSPMEDTPGFRAGILAGDRVVKVDGKNVEHEALSEVVRQLRGEPGSSVTLTIDRPSTGATKSFTLKRAIIQMAMVKDINGKKEFPLDANQIGYIHILQFGDKTSVLDQAVEVCQKFLPPGQLVVSTEGRRHVEKYYARGDGDELKDIPVVVLANLASASAAEIVTGCLQDLHRAVVLGEKTFGKGSVQTVFPLENGWALKLTVAKYYTPSHKVIHQQGITPDILVPVTDVEEAAVLLKRSAGGIESLPEKERAAVLAIHDDQIDRAEDLLKGLILYDQRSAQRSQPANAK
jgi:carboxyl-terminal processing protease